MTERDTRWSLIDAARSGEAPARDEFARLYAPAVRAYFASRWSAASRASEIDDAVQEVFVDCLRDGGALARLEPGRAFRPFLYGVARMIAARFEQRFAQAGAVALDELELSARETRSSVAFDRAYALQVMRAARERQRERAQAAGGAKLRRVELLELHLERGQSIPEIAASWGEDAARLHHLYADARADFREALRQVVAERSGVAAVDLERECEWMLEVLRPSSG